MNPASRPARRARSTRRRGGATPRARTAAGRGRTRGACTPRARRPRRAHPPQGRLGVRGGVRCVRSISRQPRQVEGNFAVAKLRLGGHEMASPPPSPKKKPPSVRGEATALGAGGDVEDPRPAPAERPPTPRTSRWARAGSCTRPRRRRGHCRARSPRRRPPGGRSSSGSATARRASRRRASTSARASARPAPRPAP